MIDFRLANVLVADDICSQTNPDLYMRSAPRTVAQKDGAALLGSPDAQLIDFTTYLNAFSNEKWRRYTCIPNVWLHIRARGSFTINYVAYESVVGVPKRVLLERAQVSGPGEQVIEYEFPQTDATFLSFELETDGPVEIREAYYYTKVDEERLRQVELAVATTTFCKEDFIIPNIELFRKEIIESSEPVADHVMLHVVDNGRTLKVDELEGERVRVHPNPNTGGAGGFTRGMIEALDQKPKATHVILMDDDIRLLPEAIKRTYNLLCLVRDEWVDAFVSGAMLSYEKPEEFHEDTGWVSPDGRYGPYKAPGRDEDNFNVGSILGMMQVEAEDAHHDNQYAGWWYCCIPTRSIERHGLPLPLFIRGDDAEYGNRAARGFITMNGICVWHMTFFNKFSASLDRYQFQRNSFIAQATTGVYGSVDFMSTFHYNVGVDLKTFNYDACEMSLRALEDYLKGPEFLKSVRGDALIRENGKYNEKPIPLEELEGVELGRLNVDLHGLYNEERRSLVLRLYDFLTYNGQRGPRRIVPGGLGVIPYDGWYYAPNEIRGKDSLLAITADGKQGVLRKKDRVRFRALLRRYERLRKEYDERRDEMEAQWAAARDELTSLDFWKWYLEDQAK